MAAAVEILEGADAKNSSSKLTRTRDGLMVSEYSVIKLLPLLLEMNYI